MASRTFTDAFAIASANTNLTRIPRALYIGATGDLSVITKNGVAVTFKTVPAGTQLELSVLQVTTNTTANNIVGLV